MNSSMESSTMLRALIRQLIIEVLEEQRAVSPVQSQQETGHNVTKTARSTQTIDRGALTERMVLQMNQDGIKTVRVTKAVAITPLAREKSRALKILIERNC